jgi:nicotinate phosphoribosyltransferase
VWNERENAGGLALNVDLYELTMAAAYFEAGFDARPTFELFVRELPPRRSYLIAAGLAQALEYLSDLKFTGPQIDYIRGLPPFKTVRSGFFDYLASLRFRGDVWAMPEGTVAFESEPLLRVTADIIEAQVVETYLLATVNFQTMVATKASRVVEAAGGRPVVDFGSRRAHGPEAGVLAARACYIGGCDATSNVEAGYRYDIPTMGTAAHSYIMAFDSEVEAFERYESTFPESASLLIDTYDTLEGARRAASFGKSLRSVRLDSGDIGELSVKVREILDQSGAAGAKIVASGDLNEDKIAGLLAKGAPVDAFGVGTEMVVSKDAPSLGGVYKMVDSGRGRRPSVAKYSAEKETYPGIKQVLREVDPDGAFVSDVLALAEERPGEWKIPLLERVMIDGALARPQERLDSIRERARENLTRLPYPYRRLEGADRYPVMLSEALRSLKSDVKRRSSG